MHNLELSPSNNETDDETASSPKQNVVDQHDEISRAIKKAKRDRSRNRRRERKNNMQRAEFDTIFRTLVSISFDNRGKPIRHQLSPGIGEAAEYIRENWSEVKRLRDKYGALSMKPHNRAEKNFKKDKL